MAGDWIKMRGGLLTNPRVIRMARRLSENPFFCEWWVRGTKASISETVTELCDMHIVTRVTVASLLALWAAANESINDDDILARAELYELDEMAGVPGFGEAMAFVGWAEEIENVGVHLPNFKEHNTFGKMRTAQSGAERMRQWRERQRAAPPAKAPVTKCDARDAREEKRREEKIQNKDSGANGSPPADEEWLSALISNPTYEGIDVRREFGKMRVWCESNKKTPSRRRFANWLNRTERPMNTQNKTPYANGGKF